MEVELAESLVGSTREVLEQLLMGEEGEKILEVQMEREKVSRLHVARFFENGLEVSFCSKTEEVSSCEVKVEPEKDKIMAEEPEKDKEPWKDKIMTEEPEKEKEPEKDMKLV